MMTSETNQFRNGRARILIIDDSAVIREMLKEILSDEGYLVDTEENGEGGSSRALEFDYDLIICDVHMPRMNGLETVRQIIGVKPQAKIILTDSFPDKLAKQARAEGAICCLQKPFDVNELRDLIGQIVAGGVIRSGRHR